MRDRGKQFEDKFKADWNKCLPNSILIRLPDQMSGYKATSRNICDFVAFNEGILYLLECKTHKGASIPFECIKQLPLMSKFLNKNGVRVGVILWLYEKDVVYYVPITTILQMKKEGKKSVGIRAVEEGFNVKIIPSIKKRVFMDSDYSVLSELEEGE